MSDEQLACSGCICDPGGLLRRAVKSGSRSCFTRFVKSAIVVNEIHSLYTFNDGLRVGGVAAIGIGTSRWMRDSQLFIGYDAAGVRVCDIFTVLDGVVLNARAVEVLLVFPCPPFCLQTSP